jgi:peptidoglycan hydrolase CwlO-like protein
MMKEDGYMNKTLQRLEIKLRRLERQRDGMRFKGKDITEISKKCTALKNEIRSIKNNIMDRRMRSHEAYFPFPDIRGFFK